MLDSKIPLFFLTVCFFFVFFPSQSEDDDDDIADQLGDPDVLRSVLSSLPGVNPDSEAIQAVIESAAQQRKADKKDDDDEEPMDQS